MNKLAINTCTGHSQDKNRITQQMYIYKCKQRLQIREFGFVVFLSLGKLYERDKKNRIRKEREKRAEQL